jgi:2-methylcitrate dehydratase PrpD
MHAPLDATFTILESESIEPEDIESATVEIAEPGVNLVGRPVEKKQNPESFVDAQFSMPFGVALAAVAGEATVDSFLEWCDSYGEDFRRIMEATEVTSSEAVNEVYPEKWCANVTIETGDGTFEEFVEYANGEPENRMSWADEIEKYEELTVDLPSGVADDLLESVRSLEDVDVSDLTAPVAGDPRAEAVADD